MKHLLRLPFTAIAALALGGCDAANPAATELRPGGFRKYETVLEWEGLTFGGGSFVTLDNGGVTFRSYTFASEPVEIAAIMEATSREPGQQAVLLTSRRVTWVELGTNAEASHIHHGAPGPDGTYYEIGGAHFIFDASRGYPSYWYTDDVLFVGP